MMKLIHESLILKTTEIEDTLNEIRKEMYANNFGDSKNISLEVYASAGAIRICVYEVNYYD